MSVEASLTGEALELQSKVAEAYPVGSIVTVARVNAQALGSYTATQTLGVDAPESAYYEIKGAQVFANNAFNQVTNKLS